MAKLAVLVPAPRAHLTRYHGILGPAAVWRPLIIPTANDSSNEMLVNPQPSAQASTAPDVDADSTPQTLPSARHRNYTWAELAKRVFLVDVLHCERCGGRMKIISSIHPPDTTRKILECLGLPSRAPPLAPAVSGFNCRMDSF